MSQRQSHGPSTANSQAKPQKPARKTGVAHFFAAASYSFAGLKLLLKESAFRQEILGFVILLAIFVFLQVSLTDFLIAGVLFLLLLGFEAFNTAIEVLVDELSPQWSQFAKDAKDLGSLAVMAVLIAHALFLISIVYRYI